MSLDSFAALLSGAFGFALAIAGLRVALRPRGLWEAWFRWERRWRERRFGGGWTPLERSTRRRGYFWVPREVLAAKPEAVAAYAGSDRFWRSRYGWFARALFAYAGLALLLAGLAVIVRALG